MKSTHLSVKYLFVLLFLLFGHTIYAQCHADAGPNVAICSNESEVLGDTPAGTGNGVITYNWAPTVGLSCTNCANPICSVDATTTYTLTVTDENGCSDQDQVTVTVKPGPTAGFTFSANNVCASIPIQFTSTSTGTGISYAWNFDNPASGSQNTSTQANPIHEFVSYGTGSQSFNVRLIVSMTNGCKDTVFQTVTVNQTPGAALIDPLTSFKNCDGTNFSMTVYNNTTVATNSNYQIIWGDGTPDFNGASFPGGGVSHVYSTVDIFDMYFIVTGTNGCRDTAYQFVSNITNPAIGAANPGATTGCGPMTLCFPLSNYVANHSSTYYVVDYGDGTPKDTLPHPPPAVLCHTYSLSSCGRPGNAFTFKITAINSCDSSIASISPIRVYTGPIANFNPVPQTQCVNVPITFMNTSVTGFNSSCSSSTIFNWNFGDGVTLTQFSLLNPTHAYSTPGSYIVTLSAQNACGTTTFVDTVCIEAPPSPNFTINPDSSCVPFIGQVTNLSNTANTCNVNYSWSVIYNGSTCLPSSGNFNFVGGTNANSFQPQIQFNGAGSYTVRLTMTNSCGVYTYDQPVVGQAPPQVAINTIPNICAGESVSPVALVNSCYELSDTYSWSFTGGSPASSTSLTPGSVLYNTAGNYTVSLTATNQCGSNTGTRTFTVNSPPVANAGPNVSFCSGLNATIGMTSQPGITYAWNPVTGLSSSGSSNPTVTLTNASASPVVNSYVLTASTSPTCLSRDTVLVTVNPIPVLSVNSATICAGESTVLTVSGAGAGGNYTWNASPSLSCTSCASTTATPAITTTYSVTGTNSYSCQSSTSTTVTVNPLPVVNAGPDQVLCDQPVSITLVGSPAGGTWSGSPNVTSAGVFTPNGAENSVLTYSYTNPVTSCSNSDQMTVIVNPPIVPTVNPTDAFCINQGSVSLVSELNATPAGGTFSGTGVSGNNFDPSTAGVGTFQIVYSYGTSTCLSSDTALITVNPQPTISVNSVSICAGDSASLTANGAGVTGTYSWSPSTFLSCSNCASTFTFPTSTTTYTVTGTNQFGCTNTANSTITVNPLPVVNAGADQILCDQPIAVTLTGTPSGGTWSGSPNVTSAGIFTPNGAEVSTLYYSYTNAATSCSNLDSVVMTVNPPIVPTLELLDSICLNSGPVALNTLLTPNPLGGTWSGTGVSANNFNPLTANTGDHTVQYTYGAGTCQTIVNATVRVNPNPIISVNSGSICVGQSIVLNASGAGTGGIYSWSPSTNLSCTNCSSTTANPVATISYNVSGTNNFGCSASAVSTVTVNTLPVVNAGSDLLLCDQPMPTTLSGTPAGGTWSGSPNVTAAGVFTPNGTEVSNLVYTYSIGATSCTNSDTIVITVNPPIIPTLNTSFGICHNATSVSLNTVLNPNPTGGSWSGTGVSTGSFDPVIAGVGNHTITYIYGVGTCQTTVTSTITVNPVPVITGTNAVICVGQSTTLTANGAGAGGTYNWSPNTNLSCTNCASTTANPTTTLTYTVSGTTSFGCSSTATSTITVNPLPVANAGNDTTLCNLPSPVQFTGTQSGGVWSGPNINSSGLFTPNGTGNFTVTYTVTLGTGCTNSDTKAVQIIDPQQANAGTDQEACFGDALIQINGLPAAGIWTGTNITAGGTFNPSVSGNFPLVYSYGAGNCLTRDTMLFTVHSLPIVSAGSNIDVCVSASSQNFFGFPMGGTWSGTGITSASNGTFNPGTAGVGVHTIVYTYVDPLTTCLNRDTLLANVHALPVLSFTNNPIVCLGTSELFTNTSTLINTSAWDFGDGIQSAITSPSHTFTSVGFFDVQLTVTTAYGCVDSITHTLEVREPPVADISILPDSACGPVLVGFTNNSTGVGLTYSWDFDNGTTSTAQNPPAIIYPAGIVADTHYIIVLDVTNFCGTVSDSAELVVMPKPTAIFGTDFSTGCSPFFANFANSSIGLPDSYSWDFGNGVTSTISDSLFQQTFTTGATPTTYSIMLAVQNECGVDTTYQSITVMPNVVDAFFNTSVTSGCEDLTVNFTQFTVGGTFYSWDFGDGNTSTAYSPSHTFTDPGTYTVSLFANDGCGYDTTSVNITVHPSPVVDFSIVPDSVCINIPFAFVNNSLGLANSAWDFGDGGTSNLTSPTHAYANSGIYQVVLTGTSLTNGCTSTATEMVQVSVNPVAQFSVLPLSGCEPLDVQFTNQSTNAAYYYWDFGDGNTSGSLNPSHTFTAAGVYSVKLIVENANGCTDTTFQNITVHPLPIADFSMNTSNTCYPPVTVNLNNLSTGAINYSWNFGNGQSSTLTNPTVIYDNPGTYTISLTATNQYGCVDQESQTITVYPTPEAAFILPTNLTCENDVLVFESTSNFADSIVWFMGDGTILSGDSVSHSYANNGSYFVTIYAYGAGGCGDTLSINTPITVNIDPIADFEYVNVQIPDPLSGTVEYTNLSQDATSYEWWFGNGLSSTEVSPIHRFYEHGMFETSLIATNEFGCTDTAIIEVEVDFFHGLFLPNAIYPGHENFEISHFVAKGVGLKEYELLIYDDWGNLIWSSTALDANGRPTEAWDGTFNGEFVQQDAYVWKVTATFLDESSWEGKEYKNGKYKNSGTVTVIR